MTIKKIHHLIRYFFILGIVAFAGYVNHVQEDVFLILIAPSLYIAHAVYSLINTNIFRLPNSEALKYYGFLLPSCLAYYTLIGFQLKQLVNERGKIKWVILVLFVGFILYIQRLSFQNLSGYITLPDF